MKKIDIQELKELFIEIKYGNNIGFEKLYNRYNKLVYEIAYSILKESHDAEDIVQIVFEKLYSLNKDKLPNNNEASWLYSVTKNETINYLKYKKNNIDLDSIYDIEDNNNEINEIIDQENYNRLISKLNNTEKEIISLKILSKLSFEEIAQIMNMPTGTVKWKYYKSINTLKILLSNLSMFIITFLCSVLAFKNTKKSSKPMNAEDKLESVENKKEDEEVEESLREEHKDKNEIVAGQETQKVENIIVDEPAVSYNMNYVGIGLISISSIFLIITVTFLIIFTKHQLNRRKKLSK